MEGFAAGFSHLLRAALTQADAVPEPPGGQGEGGIRFG